VPCFELQITIILRLRADALSDKNIKMPPGMPDIDFSHDPR
jgi:hypothetical protein